MVRASWRNERTPSVSLFRSKDSGKWLWHDFGTGETGDIIQLAIKAVENVTTVTDALYFLHDLIYYENTAISLKINDDEEYICAHGGEGRPKFLIKSILSATKAPAHIRTCANTIRGIPEREFDNFGLCWGTFDRINPEKGKAPTIAALCMKNRAGGYEVFHAKKRSEGGFSMTVGSKGFIVMPRAREHTETQLAIVEGPWDGCALRRLGFRGDLLIACGTGQIRKDIECYRSWIKMASPPYQRIILALDNDEAGREANVFFRKNLPEYEKDMVEWTDSMARKGIPDNVKDPGDLLILRLRERDEATRTVEKTEEEIKQKKMSTQINL